MEEIEGQRGVNSSGNSVDLIGFVEISFVQTFVVFSCAYIFMYPDYSFFRFTTRD